MLPSTVLPPAVIDSLRGQVMWFSMADEDFHEIQRRSQDGQPLTLTADEAMSVGILLTGFEQIKEASDIPRRRWNSGWPNRGCQADRCDIAR